MEPFAAMVSRLFLAVALAAGLGACGSPSVSPPGPGPGNQAEVCNNQRDDDGDAKVDCLDPDCFGTPACLRQVERCDNHLDDDGNGQIDCADPSCDGQSCGPGCRCEHGGVSVGAGGGGAGSGGGLGTGGGSAAGGGGSAVGGGGSATGGGGSAAGGGGSAAGGGGSAAGGGSARDGGSATGGGGSATDGGGSAAGGGSARDGGSAAGGGGSAAGGGGSAAGGGGACARCGVGCECTGGVGVEVKCGDLVDNDGDGLTDCADPDCVGHGTEICDDGIDNTCDRAIDCGDPACVASKACALLVDGSPCLRDTQCAGAKCLTEEVDGAPNGSCTNATACSPSTNAGCHGGRCALTSDTGAIARCHAPCSGDGLGATGRCRAGYACTDVDTTPSNDNNVCMASCTSDAECAGQGASYGCNPWSKTCTIKDRGLLRYGAACTADSQCETGICYTGAALPNGYCLGPCRGDLLDCATGGVCDHQTAWLDNVGTCYQGCQNSAECRSAERYTCGPLASGDGACLVW